MLDRKSCKRCKRIKSLSDYYIRGYATSGKPYYDGTCKACVLGKPVTAPQDVLVDGTCYQITAVSQTEGGKRTYYVLKHPERDWCGMWFPEQREWSVEP